jgi:Domain of unknown function (DUF4386)
MTHHSSQGEHHDGHHPNHSSEQSPDGLTAEDHARRCVFYLITFISIPTLAPYAPVKNQRDWILGSGGHTAVLTGGLLEVGVALACIGTAVTFYPVLKRQNEAAALGFAAARVLEAGMIFTGVVSLLSQPRPPH